MNECICGCDITAHHPPGGNSKVNQGCFHCEGCDEYIHKSNVTRSLDPLPCAGTNRDDEPCKGEVVERESLGIYAGRYCDGHWKTSGYRDEPASAFDPADAGETYGDEDL